MEGGTVEVVPYDPRWADEFVENAGEFKATIGSSITAVHRVGSPAVPGLCAKPILDLLVSIPDLEQALGLAPRLADLRYEFRPHEESPERHYFRRRRGTIRTHHLSLAEPTSRYYQVTSAFRDALRADAGKAREYCDLKLRLAREFPGDRAKYIEGKSAFVADVIAAAAFRESIKMIE